jgi:hypothetical protein
MNKMCSSTLRIVVIASLMAMSVEAYALPQPVFVTPPVPPVLPNLLYEIDYAVSAGNVLPPPAASNTIVSLGLPANSPVKGCLLQIAWFDWNGAPAGFSGPFPVALGQTFEFTSSGSAAPFEYKPFTENVFRNPQSPAFEGYAKVLSNCPVGTKLRVDAEFVTATPPGVAQSFEYKSINVTNPAGAIGY